MLEDGIYDAIVVDADPDEAGAGTQVELTILAGDHKGDVVRVRSADPLDDPVDLLGIPATLTVTDGRPAVQFEP